MTTKYSLLRIPFLIRIILLIVSSGALVPAGETAPRRVSWADLPGSVAVEDTIRLVLPDGTMVQGKYPLIQPDGINNQISKASNKRLHPKGKATIPRVSVKFLEVRKPRRMARLLGLLLPLGAGAAIIAGVLGSGGGGDSGGNEWLMVGGFSMAFGTPGGYFIGRSIDNRFERLVIDP